jgi:hypothetical protein
MIRIAFSSTPTDRLENLFNHIVSACRDVSV